MSMWLYFFVVYLCGVWVFCSSRRHLLFTLLILEFIALVLYFSVYFYLCGYSYGLFLLFTNARSAFVGTEL
jgi:hypothetical protein